eukprot:CAMPEP_0202777378 /NCGR_PEP_ID=MMETSP1388-20130828/52561_1 /ASSEMBLY_ACC=CAM_ASM_000864 /TAXON_ID=37098 /ORGANISM="Isochrysis sp, Strain CCMP1244" /LENGTH=359 /DNA_ID=CAMNT_0049446607 /DNA_START=368 /DNA_END=1445 /DNA_ORIENTATION=+
MVRRSPLQAAAAASSSGRADRGPRPVAAGAERDLRDVPAPAAHLLLGVLVRSLAGEEPAADLEPVQPCDRLVGGEAVGVVELEEGAALVARVGRVGEEVEAFQRPEELGDAPHLDVGQVVWHVAEEDLVRPVRHVRGDDALDACEPVERRVQQRARRGRVDEGESLLRWRLVVGRPADLELPASVVHAVEEEEGARLVHVPQLEEGEAAALVRNLQDGRPAPLLEPDLDHRVVEVAANLVGGCLDRRVAHVHAPPEPRLLHQLRRDERHRHVGPCLHLVRGEVPAGAEAGPALARLLLVVAPAPVAAALAPVPIAPVPVPGARPALPPVAVAVAPVALSAAVASLPRPVVAVPAAPPAL